MKCMKLSTKYLKIAANYIMMALLIFVCLYVLPRLIVYFLPFVIALIIALITNPVVRFLDKRLKIRRKAGSAVVIILTLALVIAACYGLIYLLIYEISGLVTDLPKIWRAISDASGTISREMNRLFAKMPVQMQLKYNDIGDTIYESITGWVASMGEDVAQSVSDSVKHLPLTIIGIIMGVLASYTFVAERDKVSEFIKKIIPKSVIERADIVSDTIRTAVGGYFKAQFKIMAVVYVVLFVGMLILRVDYAFIIALLIAFLDFLPFFGTGTVMIPWAIIEFTQKDYRFAIGMLVVWGLSQLVRQVIQPKVLGDTVGMPAIPTLFLLYIGFRMGGAIGLIVAVPLGMILLNVYKAGLFSNFIYSTRILLKDFKAIRVFTDEELKAEGINPTATGIDDNQDEK